MISYGLEVERGVRFEFGEIWSRFLSLVDSPRVADSAPSLDVTLIVEGLVGNRFPDAGFSCRLFSLVDRRVCAKVLRFNLNLKSVSRNTARRGRFLLATRSRHWELIWRWMTVGRSAVRATEGSVGMLFVSAAT
jgi:hypothetical protein